MAPSPLQQRRTHNTLLFQKLLSLRDGASPFTLVLDTLEQGGGCVVMEFVRRAKISKSKIIFISYATLRKKLSFDPDIFLSARSKPLSTLRTEILSHLPLPPSATNTSPTKTLIIIDTLTNLSTTHLAHLPAFLSSLLTSSTTSLLCTLHTDIPLPSPSTPYSADALITLTHLATAILSVSSFAHVLARKMARDKSVQEPVFGLWEKREGVLVGLRGEGESGAAAVVVRMEVRRRSGRGVLEDFVLLPPSISPTASPPSSLHQPPNANTTPKDKLSTTLLLDEHPLYTSTPLIPTQSTINTNTENETDDVETTFSLGLTEKQKRDREAVVLPYFDAQKEGGGNMEGGRILYDMGAEDREDFDDEEDEI
ncbi:Elongator complex protein [Lachnellula hyalina]|uniref:Elongator complex protein 5 n=1 Tax=Lachnellula hyalina TaxID=1316788 RepID=A0A8H8R1B5_9HELO|nr:Elongator complex protein [Lachnellula hyalina]TVY25605.1 Elongator complex protein [Lachnellula hyalina]